MMMVLDRHFPLTSHDSVLVVFLALCIQSGLLIGFALGDQDTSPPETIFNDPEYSAQQWVFDMIDVYPVWQQGIFGNGVRVRINDAGMDPNHPEFGNRFDVNASCESYETSRAHGTAVASILGAEGNNTECAVGIAPQVTLSSCVVSTLGLNDLSVLNGTWLAHKIDQYDISQNSYGFPVCRPADPDDPVSSASFPDILECPFTYTGPLIYQGHEYNSGDFPCDACTFPLQQPSSKCIRSIREHCNFFFENDMPACSGFLEIITKHGECGFRRSRDIADESLETGARDGRDGKGIIYVFAAGNAYASGSDVSSKPRLASRFIISVGAVGQDRIKAQYSDVGTALFVSAPAGDVEYATNQMGAIPGGGCGRTGLGTSFACPIVSGVVALMIEANPNLSWRDVQGILAATSQPVNHTLFHDETAVLNGAGFWHSNLYGFGIIDASKAVNASQHWDLFGVEEMRTATVDDLNLPIGDDPTDPTVAELLITSPGPRLIVENVEVLLTMKHLSRGHLKITLTSPNGTKSELTPGKQPENAQLAEDTPWRLRTVRSWGEFAEGVWTIELADEKAGDVSQCVDIPGWSVFAFGYDGISCTIVEYSDDNYDADRLLLVDILYKTGAKDACCACGGGNASGDSCQDLPGYVPSCMLLEEAKACLDGVVHEDFEFYQLTDELGRTVFDACCVMGGGITYSNPDIFEDLLIGWEINIFGHEEDYSFSPSELPSESPSVPSQGGPQSIFPNSGSKESVTLDGTLLLSSLAIGIGLFLL